MKAFEWTNPRSVGEAVGQLGPASMAKAGGVELMDLLKERLVAPDRLVNLRTVPGLDRVHNLGAEGTRVGPLVTLARLAEDPLLAARHRALSQAAAHAATPQIRNMATLGGNLLQKPHCWYYRNEAFPCRRKAGATCFAHEGENAYHAVFAHDVCAAAHPSSTAVALVALGASLELTGPAGRRVVALESFYLAPQLGTTRDNVRGDDEMITDIVLPPARPEASSAYVKQAEKESYDWPLVEVAVAIERSASVVTRASIVLGAVAPVPLRARAAETAMLGHPIDEATAQVAARAALQGASPLRDNAYKLSLVEVVVRRALLAAGKAEAQR